jgi:hypothetical protein
MHFRAVYEVIQPCRRDDLAGTAFVVLPGGERRGAGWLGGGAGTVEVLVGLTGLSGAWGESRFVPELKAALLASPGAMDQLCEQFLAGGTLGLEENVGIGASHLMRMPFSRASGRRAEGVDPVEQVSFSCRSTGKLCME